MNTKVNTMDPNVVLLRYRKAFETKNHQEAREAFFALVDWLVQGGFPPSEPMTKREARIFSASVSAVLGKTPTLVMMADESEPN